MQRFSKAIYVFLFLHYYAVILLIAYPFRDQASPYQQISLYRSVINFIFNMCEIMHASWKRNSRVAIELQAVRTSFNLTMVYAKKKAPAERFFMYHFIFVILCFNMLLKQRNTLLNPVRAGHKHNIPSQYKTTGLH